jgi:hypothetical protein
MAKAILMDSDEEVIPETSSDEEDDTAQRKSLAPAWSVVTAAASTLKDMLDPRTSSITLKVLSLPPPSFLPPSLLSLHTYIDTRFIHFTE